MSFSIRRALLSSVAFTMLALGGAGVSAAHAETLKQAMAKAYETNPVLLAQRAALRGTDEEVAQALSQWRPTVSVNASAQDRLEKTRTLVPTKTRSSSEGWSSSITASQTLFAGGRILAQRLLAGAQVRAGRAQLIATEQNVLLGVVSAYMDVVRDEEVVRLNETSVKLLKKQREAAQERFKVGEITRTDVAQAEARLAQAEAGLIAAQAGLRSSQLEYERIVGNPPKDLEKNPALPTVPPSEDEVRRLAEANAPNYIAAQENVRIGEHSVNIAVGSLLPTVSVQASYTHGEVGTSFGDPSAFSNGTSVVGTINMPIYQGGVEWSNIRQSEENLNKFKMDQEQTRRTTLETASNSWESFRAARASRESNAQQLKAQETAFEGVQQEAEVGARTTLDVLDAQRELLNSQVALARSQRDEVVAAHNVLASVGALTAENLQLGVVLYDPVENYDDNAGKWWGPKGFGL